MRIICIVERDLCLTLKETMFEMHFGIKILSFLHNTASLTYVIVMSIKTWTIFSLRCLRIENRSTFNKSCKHTSNIANNEWEIKNVQWEFRKVHVDHEMKQNWKIHFMIYSSEMYRKNLFLGLTVGHKSCDDIIYVSHIQTVYEV